MKTPERTIKVKLLEKEYEVEFPATRGLIEISIQKANISRQTYDAISASGSADDTYSRFTIDMIATFRVMIKDIEKDLNVSNFLDLDPLHAKQFLSVYLKEVLPWIVEWQKVLNAEPEEKKEPSDGQS